MSLLIWLRVALVLPAVVLNTLLHALPLFAVALLKAVLPGKGLKRMCNGALTGFIEKGLYIFH